MPCAMSWARSPEFYHLAQERKPEREEDLRDIVALAILQRADEDFKHLWPGQWSLRSLARTSARYALLSGGDLHATVRDYLRRYWRDDAERPDIFEEVASAPSNGRPSRLL